MKNKITVWAAIFFIAALCAGAQTITSLNPASGPIGTLVTISGSGFAATGNFIHFQNAALDAIWETRINASSANGSTLQFAVPAAVNPECYYQVPQCASPALPVTAGPFIVFVETAGVKSNSVMFTVTGTTPAYSLSIQADDTYTTQITVTVDPPGNTTRYPITYTYTSPTTVTIKANDYINMSGGSKPFWEWSGDLTGSTNPATLLVDGVKSITANYGGDIPSIPPTPGPTPAPTPVVTCSYIIGDANGNGTVDIVDALVIAQYYVGMNPSTIEICAGDVNHDGSVNIVDALLVAQCYIGLRSCSF